MMSGPSLALFLCLIVASHATSERRPLRAAVDQVLDVFLDVVAPVSDILGDSPCRRQGLLYRRAVKEGKIWALRMLDAGAKIPSGLLQFNVVQLGDFHACLDVRHEDPDEGVIMGQHCQVSFGPLNGMSALSVFEKATSGGFNITAITHFTELLDREDYGSASHYTSGSWAVCVPAACSGAEIQKHLRSMIPDTLIRVNDHSCTSNADDVPVVDWHAVIACVLLAMLSVLLAIGTAYDLLTGDASGPPRIGHPLLAFSLYNNIRLLFGYDNTPKREDVPKTNVVPKQPSPASDILQSLNGIRVLATIGISLGHFYMAKFMSPLGNISYVVSFLSATLTMVLSNATLYVDTFLVLSGLLLSYTFIRQRERNTKFSWQRFFLNRYVRIAPAHVATLLVSVAASPFVKLDAPLAKANMEHIREKCFNTRWLSLLYISNYLDKDHLCHNVTWYLGIEMQLLLLSPLVLYPLWRRPRLGMILITMLSLAGTALVFSIAYEHRLHVISPLTEKIPSANIDNVYEFTHTRCVPWFIGLAVGSLLSRRVVPSRRQAALGWCACACLAYYSMFHANASFQHDFVPDRLHSAIYFAVIRPSWAFASAWVMYSCETGAGGYLNAFLSWQGWQLPGRLCYGVFLTHFLFLLKMPAWPLTKEYFLGLNALTEYLGTMVLSLFAAVVLLVAVEMPCNFIYQAYQSSATVAKNRSKKES